MHKQKLQFLSRLDKWLKEGPRPLILGVDTNCRGFDEENAKFWEPTEPIIWGREPEHGLRDTWSVLGKPFSATHYVSRTATRFDQIWTTDGIRIIDAEHHFKAAKAYGSDHALVTANIAVD